MTWAGLEALKRVLRAALIQMAATRGQALSQAFQGKTDLFSHITFVRATALVVAYTRQCYLCFHDRKLLAWHLLIYLRYVVYCL